MGLGGYAGAAAQDDLRTHELSVVLTKSAGERFVAGVASVGRLGPLPYIAEELLGRWSGGGAGLGVEVVGLHEVAGDGLLGGDELPLELRGEAVAGPAGEGIRLKEAEVAYGAFGDLAERTEALQGEDGPAGGGVGVASPVERRLPAFGLEGVPTFREPELGAGVAVVFDEGEVLGAGDGAGGEMEGREIDGVARGLVVEGEGVDFVGIGRGADADDAGAGGGARGEADPVERWSNGVRGGGKLILWGWSEAVGGVKRVCEEGVLYVGGGQLEVLLLVLEAEDDAALGFVFGRTTEEALDSGVDVAAVGEDLVEGRTREGGAQLLFRHLAEGPVVGVEEPAEFGIEGMIAGNKLGEDEGLEEPGGVWARCHLTGEASAQD